MGDIISRLLAPIIEPLLNMLIGTVAATACATIMEQLDLPAGYSCSSCSAKVSNTVITSMTGDMLVTAECGGDIGSGTFYVGKKGIAVMEVASIAAGDIFLGAVAEAKLDEREIECSILGSIVDLNVEAQSVGEISVVMDDGVQVLPVPLTGPSTCTLDGKTCAVSAGSGGFDEAFQLDCGGEIINLSFFLEATSGLVEASPTN